jgi:hypothetical protein
MHAEGAHTRTSLMGGDSDRVQLPVSVKVARDEADEAAHAPLPLQLELAVLNVAAPRPGL